MTQGERACEKAALTCPHLTSNLQDRVIAIEDPICDTVHGGCS